MGQLRDGTKTIAAAATAVRLVATSTPAEWVKLWANSGNTGTYCVVGGSTVVAAEATRRGGLLDETATAIRSVMIPGPLDLTDVWVDTDNNGDKVHFLYMEP